MRGAGFLALDEQSVLLPAAHCAKPGVGVICAHCQIRSRPRCLDFGVFFVPVDDGSIERPNIFIWGMLEMYLIFFCNWSSCPAGSPRAGSDFEKAREVGAGI